LRTDSGVYDPIKVIFL